MSETPPTVPSVPPPEKKSMPPIAWVGIGCGTLVIIGVVIASLLVGYCKRKMDDFTKNPEKTAAEMMVRLNPDLEVVRTDDAAGEMTFRTKDGKETTLSYKEISEGRITVEDTDGNMMRLGAADLSQVPVWVPRLPEMSEQSSAFHSESPKEIVGAYAAKTTLTPDAVEEFLKSETGNLGLSDSSRSVTTVNARENRTLAFSDGKRKLTVNMVSEPNAPLSVQVAYSERR